MYVKPSDHQQCLSFRGLTTTVKPVILRKYQSPRQMFIPSTEDETKLIELLSGIFPYYYVERSTLGGEENASIIVKVSFEAMERWINGIYHNSRYAMFHIGEGKIEQFSRSKTEKFRKCNAKSIEEAANKIIAWSSKH